MPFSLSLYQPLLEQQRRDGVEGDPDLAYGEDPRHRLDAYRPHDKYPEMSTVSLIDAPAFPLLITYAELDLLQMQVQAGEFRRH